MVPGRRPLFTFGKDRAAGDKGHHSIDTRVAPEDATKSTTGGIATEVAPVTIFRRDEERSRKSKKMDPMGWYAPCPATAGVEMPASLPWLHGLPMASGHCQWPATCANFELRILLEPRLAAIPA